MDNEIVSDFTLERFVLGELPLEIHKKITWMAAVDPKVKAAVKAIESSTREILALYPSPFVKKRLLSRMKDIRETRTRPGRTTAVRKFPRFLPVAAAAAVSVIILVLGIPGLRDKAVGIFRGGESDSSLVKGIQSLDLSRTQLLVFRQTAAQVEMLEDVGQARTGDLLQLAYVAAGDRFGIILSIDGRGLVTLHLPEEEGGPTTLVQHRKFLLPNAIELDDAPDFERFFLITSASPVDVAAVLGTAETLASNPGSAMYSDLDLREGLRQFSVLILKGERP